MMKIHFILLKLCRESGTLFFPDSQSVYCLLMCFCAVYVDVRYETKGTFSPHEKYTSHSYREFIGYVIVAKNSTMQLSVRETLRHWILVVVLSSLHTFLSLNSAPFIIQQHF